MRDSPVTLAALLYAATVSAAAFTALIAPTAGRRRAARDVLTILVRRTETTGREPNGPELPPETGP
ncbi:hypothetical protein GCM10010172_62290 [Paractinoplanes ferrugineus]|uniref:Uncharacterized protein n=1 Tax=Paractinoplanes ferrugineus TaxID=113564 RepID=A0A919MJ11_9ACTN|nr:hypothetical protein [Actinoplanes ferrugineus]GIE16609.1 hypothetical protein Afe05nite_84490 [Actinoplanes ferrugineus]